MLPQSLTEPLRCQVEKAKLLHEENLATKPSARRTDETTVEWRVERQRDVVKEIANVGLD